MWPARAADPEMQFSTDPEETYLCQSSIWQSICFRSTTTPGLIGDKASNKQKNLAFRLLSFSEQFLPLNLHYHCLLTLLLFLSDRTQSFTP